MLGGQAKAREAIHDGIIPANIRLAEAELMLGGKMGRELSLKKALREVRDDYDLILIDCPPALGLLTVNALVAADYALLSAEAQYFALQGVEQALEVIELARDNLNPDLEWLGVVLNIADMRTRHSREAFDSLREHFGEKLLDTTIRSSIAYAESAERAVSILDYRPDLAVDYLDVAEELLRAPGDGRASPPGRLAGRQPPHRLRQRLERAHVGAVGLKRRAHHRRPSPRLARERLDDRPGLLVVRPDEHASGPAPEIVAPSAPSVASAVAATPLIVGTGALAAADADGRRGRRRSGPSRRGPARGPASTPGHVEHRVGHRYLVRQRGPRGLGADGLARHHEHGLEPHRRVETMHARALADHKPALERGRDVVGVTLELGRERHHVGVELEDVVGRQQPCHDRGGA